MCEYDGNEQRRADILAILASDGCKLCGNGHEPVYDSPHYEATMKLRLCWRSVSGDVVTPVERVHAACEILNCLDDYIGRDPGW